MINRRLFLSASLATAGATLAGCSTTPVVTAVAPPSRPPLPLFYAAIPDEPFPIPALRPGIVPPEYWRQEVADPTGEAPGTIVVDPNTFYLYWTQPGGLAMRYGIGVGKQGFGWSGDARIAFKRKWPTWTPPAEMIARDPTLEKYSAANGGQPPGLDNALGARALYLFQGGKDTLYRLHGTNEPRSIGHAVSSGCIRLLNHDIIDLYERVPNDTRVVVRASRLPATLA